MAPTKLKEMAAEGDQQWTHAVVEGTEADEIVSAYLNSRPFVGMSQAEPTPVHNYLRRDKGTH
jgi:hypothetical protein